MVKFSLFGKNFPGRLDPAAYGDSGMEKWFLLDSGALEGRRNMSIDLRLLERAEKGLVPPVLRFYRWRPPAVSLGASQVAREEVDEEFCRERGIEIVRRPSGGGAILHDDELTYSFTAPDSLRPSFGDLLRSYHEVVEGVRRGLAALGVAVDLRGGKGDPGPERYRPCFALSSRHDLTFRGLKIVGSAQRRRRGAFLQHGSIPYAYDRELVEGVFLRPDDFFEKAASLSGALGRTPSDREVREALVKGFASAFGVEFEKFPDPGAPVVTAAPGRA